MSAPACTAVSITQLYVVPDAHIVALIDCAGVHAGIGYWTDAAVTDQLHRTLTVCPDAEARLEPDVQTRVLKFDWIAKRLVQLGVGSPLLKGIDLRGPVAGHARQYLADLLNPQHAEDADSNFDAELADAVIQLAFFDGEVVFG